MRRILKRMHKAIRRKPDHLRQLHTTSTVKVGSPFLSQHRPTMSFQQTPPELGNQYEDDRVLRSYLHRVLPASVLHDVRDELRSMGGLAGGALHDLQREDRLNEPHLTQWDAWGNRIDEIELTPLWRRAEELAARQGLVAAAYEQEHGPYSRIHQLALAHLFIPSTDVYGCPLAMTDGAARTLLASDHRELIDEVVPHLTSRDPDTFWTSGQWMTELTGGSDVGRSETTARQDEDGTWRLYGRKWFTSAITAQMALALARPEQNVPGGRGLALFYVKLRDDEGRLQHIYVNRLKDKLGTRKLPTAELTLDGTPAVPVSGLRHGTRRIAPMLNITRTWNAVMATAYMRRGVALARDYAAKREAFGSPLAEKPLHLDTLAGLQAEFEGAFHLTFRLAELLGRSETNEASGKEMSLLRLLTPLAKLTTAKQAVAHASETVEAFGGAGYVEDTGLPVLLRDAQVLPIWEGTTNVLSLDVLRALKDQGLAPYTNEIRRCLDTVGDDRLQMPADTARRALDEAKQWLHSAQEDGREQLEAGARRLALTLGRTAELALLCRHAQWALDEQHDLRSAAAAQRLASEGVTLLAGISVAEAAALANEMPLPTPTEKETV